MSENHQTTFNSGYRRKKGLISFFKSTLQKKGYYDGNFAHSFMARDCMMCFLSCPEMIKSGSFTENVPGIKMIQ